MTRLVEWLFVDTSAFIALHDASDRYHKMAKGFFTPERIRDLRVHLVTTSFVFAEVYSYFCKNHTDAIAVGSYIRDSKILRHIRPDLTDEEAAWQIAKKYNDKDFSFVDCLSFAIMFKIGCNKAFTFDSHFRQMGFEVFPSPIRLSP
ncbi:MAG: PIN domain-containing protein [Firmicutes bacterium]|nr:PIN domain-containing protein [Bacillota bacterium]